MFFEKFCSKTVRSVKKYLFYLLENSLVQFLQVSSNNFKWLFFSFIFANDSFFILFVYRSFFSEHLFLREFSFVLKNFVRLKKRCPSLLQGIQVNQRTGDGWVYQGVEPIIQRKVRGETIQVVDL